MTHYQSTWRCSLPEERIASQAVLKIEAADEDIGDGN